MNRTNEPLVAWKIYDRFEDFESAEEAAFTLFEIKPVVTVQKVDDIYLVMYTEGRKYYVR